MIDFISEKFTEIVSKCLERNAKEQATAKKNMQLVFKLGESGEAEYLIYKDYKPVKVVTFMEVLGVKLDFKGYSLFVPNFIKGALTRFCEQHSIERNKVRVIVSFDEGNKMVMWLYNNTEFVSQVTLDELIDAKDIITE